MHSIDHRFNNNFLFCYDRMERGQEVFEVCFKEDNNNKQQKCFFIIIYFIVV